MDRLGTRFRWLPVIYIERIRAWVALLAALLMMTKCWSMSCACLMLDFLLKVLFLAFYADRNEILLVARAGVDRFTEFLLVSAYFMVAPLWQSAVLILMFVVNTLLSTKHRAIFPVKGIIFSLLLLNILNSLAPFTFWAGVSSWVK